MLPLSLVAILVPLAFVVVGIVLLLVLVNTIGILFGLLWPALPILIGVAVLWRLLRGGRR